MLPAMRVAAVITLAAGRWLAYCEEVDRAGEGATAEEALANLRKALTEYFSQTEAVAPPAETASPPAIEIVITDSPTG
jgi:predicted RNase H-like HicB family nuclease